MNEGYKRDVAINEPGMVGARWWNKSLVAYDKSVSRRKVLKGIAVAGGVAVFLGLAIKGISSAAYDGDDEREATELRMKKSLEMQRSYGWDFGARGQMLVYDGVKLSPFDRTKLASLPDVVTPTDPDHKAFHRGTLTESLAAKPTTTLPEDPERPSTDPPFAPLADVLVPIESTAMKTAYAAGEALARLAKGRETVDGKRLGLLVDMQGAECVAFAAGAAELFEPVLLFDNWPHPKGVVDAHNALAAFAFYQPRFEATKKLTRNWPAFLVDRGRHATYSDASSAFDNRYYARFPSADALREKGITQLLYVVSGPSSLPEPIDLNGPLADLSNGPLGGAVGARALAASDFRAYDTSFAPPSPSSAPAPSASAPAPSASGTASTSGPAAPSASASSAPPAAPAPRGIETYFGTRPETDASIWTLYPMFKNPPTATTTMPENAATKHRFYRSAIATQKEPESFGVVGVMVAATSGIILAAALDRAGSMNRFSGGWSG